VRFIESRQNTASDVGVRKIAFVADYLPRKCGIATFTADLLSAMTLIHPETQCLSVAVNDAEAHYEYPEVVRFEVEEQDLSSYLRAADFLNISNVDVVSLQHEFGIFGGNAGGHVLGLLRELRMPAITTLHTVLQDPKPDQRRVMEEIISLSTRVVVMTERGGRMLQELYGASGAKIDVIPHGIPDIGFVDPTFYKHRFDVDEKMVLLTFGLLSPGKGIEIVLKALPDIVAKHPEVVYIVLGATHPNELRERGESYRLGLEILTKKLGVESNVIFYDQFVDHDSLKAFIGAADLYITPYLNEAQITSGTLAYSFGAGKAIISTPYWHAEDLLAEGRGVLVPFGDHSAISREVINLLSDDNRRNAMRERAYKLGREMVWSEVARTYMHCFETSRVQAATQSRLSLPAKTLDQRPRDLPVLKLTHLARLTDSTGIFQHATFSVPNFSHGYCTDDNARALILTVLLSELGDNSDRLRSLGTTYAAFLHHAFDNATKRFHNLMSFDRRWIDEERSEDSQGRAMWALGTAVGRSSFRSFQMLAGQLFSSALPNLAQLSSPRAWAFGLLGIHEYLLRLNGDSLVNQTRELLAARLLDVFDRSSHADWLWFEDSLSYDNAKLPHALILTGRATNQFDLAERGLQALRWLMNLQCSPQGHFRPIGSNGFHQRGGKRADFDQQPLEAQATISACLEAYRTTSDIWWHSQAQSAFDWFMGWNDLGLKLYSPETGGCSDGLHVDRINQNEGAESTLAFLLALAEMQMAQNVMTAFPLPLVEGG
jgi:glycosyltransferase involved in cell wall biosynthesis